ncbi:MAG: UvrB/UvrC motif-containing protein [Solibacillus sp.]
MLCGHCKQRPANVTVTQVQNDQKVERYYCEICAAQFHPFQFEVSEEPVSIQQFISNWLNFLPASTTKEIKQATEKKATHCPTCGLTYRLFLKQGKFGCENCYETFSEQLPQLLERIQAGTKHVGFKEQTIPIEKIKQQIEALREQMQRAIIAEHFEDAAKIRDEIRVLESKVYSGGEGQS